MYDYETAIQEVHFKLHTYRKSGTFECMNKLTNRIKKESPIRVDNRLMIRVIFIGDSRVRQLFYDFIKVLVHIDFDWSKDFITLNLGDSTTWYWRSSSKRKTLTKKSISIFLYKIIIYRCLFTCIIFLNDSLIYLINQLRYSKDASTSHFILLGTTHFKCIVF